MGNVAPRPKLLFFRSTPSNLMSRPPLCSSLQNLESCFFLIGMDRFPHALVACASAIESCLKAGFNVSQRQHIDLVNLLALAKGHSQKLQQFNQNKIDNFRRTRNSFVHFGFTEADDSGSAQLLLETGFNFLDLCYQEFFTFELNGGLLFEYYDQLRNAIDTYEKVKNIQGIDFTYCFMAFTHLFRWALKDNFTTYWESQAMEKADSCGGTFNSCEEYKENLETAFEPCYFFDCPICDDIEALGCQLDNAQLDLGIVHITQAICVSCGLKIPEKVPYLADLVCKKELEENKEKILEEFGIELSS